MSPPAFKSLATYKRLIRYGGPAGDCAIKEARVIFKKKDCRLINQ